MTSVTDTKGYQLGIEAGRKAWILCLECNRKSFHPQDVAERYCGRCRRFHDEPLRDAEVA